MENNNILELSTNYITDGFIIKNNDGLEEVIHIPYNINNILIKEKDIELNRS